MLPATWKQRPVRKPKPTIGVDCASILERLSQTGAGLVSDRAAYGVLDLRADRVAADQQGHRQSAAPAAHRRGDPRTGRPRTRLTGSLLSPASAAWPPRGLGGGGALLRRPD